jgi:hypothetical protein
MWESAETWKRGHRCNSATELAKKRSQVGTNYIPPIYVIKDDMRATLSMFDHKIFTYPCYEVILKTSLDQLVQQIW